MKLFNVAALALGAVTGYNFYLHVWDRSVPAGIVTAAVSSFVFIVWFHRINRIWVKND